MACDHNTTTDTAKGDKYILVYCGEKLLMAAYSGGTTSTAHTVEIMNSAQELLDRGLTLGLKCSIDQLLDAAEHGAILNDFCEAYLFSEVWNMDISFIDRAKALGYAEPQDSKSLRIQNFLDKK